MRRLIAAAESLAIDYGGISIVSRATGVSRRAIARGIVELGNPPVPFVGAIRKPGGGRKSTVEQDATLVRDLELLIEPLSRGDPESPLRWTCKSVRKLAQELGRRGHRVSHRLVAELLHELGYSLQANAKTLEGSSHPDRNAQFEHIHQKVRRFLKQGQPVISVETKKKELVIGFKNGGRELRLKGPRNRCGCMTSSFPSWDDSRLSINILTRYMILIKENRRRFRRSLFDPIS